MIRAFMIRESLYDIVIIEMKSEKMSIRPLNENIQNIRLRITNLYQKYLKCIKLSLHSLHT